MIDIVVTGLGAVSSAGIGADCLWDAARTGLACVSDRLPAESTAIRKTARVVSFDPNEFLPKTDLAALDRFSQFALVAAGEAMNEAGIAERELAGSRTGVIFGSAMGGATTIETAYNGFLAEPRLRSDPLSVPRIMANAAACHVAKRYRVMGPTMTLSTACASAAQAIGTALALMRAGTIDRAIVGGSEAMLTPGILRAWEALRVLSPTLARPFSRGRDGMLIGEGAGVLMLERAIDARARGAAPLARLGGYGTSCDAGDLLRPDPVGAALAISNALKDSGLAPSDIGYINAHGTGTVHNDVAEAAAIQSVFGDGAVASSTKPIHGHTIGAAAALELIVTICALRDDYAPPTINWLGQDPNCPIDPVPNVGRALKMHAAISNSFAFGGINACLVVSKA